MSRRIRSIKPDFFSDEKLARLCPLDRFVFVGLISMADDKGRLPDNLKQINATLFPETDDCAGESLRRLAELDRIIRYETANAQRIIQIRHFCRHQRIERPNPRFLPPPPGWDPAIDERFIPTVGFDRGPTEVRSTNVHGSVAGESFGSQRDFAAASMPGDGIRNGKMDHGDGSRQSTSEALHQAAAATANESALGEGLMEMPGVVAFLSRFYDVRPGSPPTERQRDIIQQLMDTLSPNGARLSAREGNVRAANAAHLDSVCQRVARSRSVRMKDKAIVILLKGLRETYAETIKMLTTAQTQTEEAEKRIELEAAETWIRSSPEEASRVDDALADIVPPGGGSMQQMVRAAARESLLLQAFRRRLSPGGPPQS